MKAQVRKLDFTGQTIFVGIDTHKKSWSVTLQHEELMLKTFSQNPSIPDLYNHLVKNYPNAEFKCAYEAGFCGFWIQKGLTKLGVNCIVVNPADVPTTHKESEFKDDYRDSRKIAKSLRSGTLEPIYIPSDANLGARSVVRLYDDTVKHRTRSKNKIKAILNFYGVEYPQEFKTVNKHWSSSFYAWLKTVELPDENSTETFRYYIEEALRANEQVKIMTKRVRKLAKTPLYENNVKLLRTIPGVGLITAIKFLTEIEDIHRFQNIDQLCGYLGLVPKTSSSGERQRVGSMTNRGNRHVKSALIESAWMAIRYDSAMLQSYLSYIKRMKGNQAIVRVAKKLVARIMFVLKNQKPYELRTVNNLS
jgi:transposase